VVARHQHIFTTHPFLFIALNHGFTEYVVSQQYGYLLSANLQAEMFIGVLVTPILLLGAPFHNSSDTFVWGEIQNIGASLRL
jgi:hypothetical protein